MKQNEFEKCIKCDKGMMHNNQIAFFVVNIKYMGMDLNAVREQHGLEMSMGAAAPLAQIMGPNRDLAKPIDQAKAFLCMDCAIQTRVWDVFEMTGNKKQEEEKGEKDGD